MRRKPANLEVSVPAGAESDEVVIPAGTTRCTLSPRNTTTVQVSFINNGSNTTGQFFQLINGQGFTFDLGAGDEFEEFRLFFFAATAMIVDVVYW